MEKFEPETQMIIRDFETLRVVADALHTQILKVLVPEAMTIKQVAERLGLAPSKLYYHFDLLERHGLIRMVETRMVSNMVEKLYRAAARDVDVDPALLTISSDSQKAAIETLLSSTIDAFREDLLRSIQARQEAITRGEETHPRKVVINHQLARLTDEQAEDFHNRLEALMREYAAIDENNPPVENDPRQNHGLFLAMYPSFYFPEERK